MNSSAIHPSQRLIPLALGLLLLFLLVLPAGARNNIRTSFFNAYPTAVGSRLDNLPSIQTHCGVCHFQFTGAGPRNLYGQALEAVLPQYPNTDAGRQQAIRSIENLDPDTDGYTSLIEVTDLIHYVNTPTFPGLNPTNVGGVSGVNPNDILNYLVPQMQGDTQAPQVTLTSPNGGESWTGGSVQTVTWIATDNVGVTGIDVFYRDGETALWKMIARDLGDSGSFIWFVHNTPTPNARVRIVARDAAGNTGQDQSNGLFTLLAEGGGIVPTTLRDFELPGSQPFGSGQFQAHTACTDCHGGYDPAVEPGHNFLGSMMAQAARDPIFFANVAIAQQDATSSGDLCLRCHTPMGWLSGRSNPTDGSQLTALDRDGVACDYCHRAVDPIYEPGVSPIEDEAVLAGLEPGHAPTSHGVGQFVVDPVARRRGPFTDPVAPHEWLASPFHRQSEICGTCHDVSNPVFVRMGDGDYAPAPLDQMPDSVDSYVLLPVERTYSEWQHSAFVDGVYAPEFAGNKPDGIVSTCQDCHMRDVSGMGANTPETPLRPDLPLHDMMGGNTWMPGIVADLFPGEVDPVALADGAQRAHHMLGLAASLDLSAAALGDSFQAEVMVTNRTPHKLPSGYPEGRRIWIHLEARDEGGATVYASGVYDAGTGELHHDPEITVYETELGISPGLAGALGLTPGPSFHFVLNDSVYLDNRIPPMGFTNAGFAAFGGAPVDPHHAGPEPRYADGQYWDTRAYHLPSTARTVIATLYYQTTSKEFVEFLRDANTTNDAGDLMYDLWVANGKAAPIAMVADTVEVAPTGVVDGEAGVPISLHAASNPFREGLELRAGLPRPGAVELQVYDLQGRRVWRQAWDRLGAGFHRLIWNGCDEAGRSVGAGVYWVRMAAAGEVAFIRVVRLR